MKDDSTGHGQVRPPRPRTAGEGAAEYEVTLEGRAWQVRVELLGQGDCGLGRRYRVVVDEGPERIVEVARPVADVLSILVDGHSRDAGLVPIDGGFEVEIGGIRHDAMVVDPRRKALRLASGTVAGVVRTQMPGRVVKLLVAPGDEVAEGQPLVVVEAMKMENELRSPRGGRVKSVRCQAGDLVEARAVLVELE